MKRFPWLKPILLPLAGIGLILAALWAIGVSPVDLYEKMFRLYSNRDAMKRFLKGYGAWSPVVFILLQAFQVVVAPIPGEITGIMGGWLFGAWAGFVYSTVGLSLGSAGCFGLAHWLGRKFVHRVTDRHILEKLDFMTKTPGVLVTFVLFLIPGFPKDYLSYFLGLSSMRLGTFVWVSTLGRMPGTWLLAVQGGAAGKDRYVTLAVLILFAFCVVSLAYLFRGRLTEWARKAATERPPASSP